MRDGALFRLMRRAAPRAALLVGSTLWSLGACSKSVVTATDAGPSPVTDATGATMRPSLAAGRRVVVEFGDAAFWEATVTGVSTSEVQVRVGAETHSVALERAHDIAAWGTGPAPGTFAACRIGAQVWAACRVDEGPAGGLAATDEWGSLHALALTDAVELDTATQSRVKARIERMERARAFVREASKARVPTRPEGWRPLPGKLVVAWYGDTLWREARVVDVRPLEVELVWLARGTRAKRPSERIAPTTGRRRQPVVGRFALARRAGVADWEVFRVLRVDEREVELRDRYDAGATFPTADVVALDE